MTDCLLLRPEAKCQRSVAAFQAADLAAVGLPLMDTEVQREQCEALGDWLAQQTSELTVIVTSTEAVRHTGEVLVTHLGEKARVLSVGASTARALSELDIKAHSPEPESSEGLLAMPELQNPEGRSVVLIKGQGGRNLLVSTLTERGADLHCFEVYRRKVKLDADPTSEWQKNSIRCIIATSGELIDAAFKRFEADWLVGLHWVVVSERLKEQLHQRGVTSVTVSEDASDDALIRATNAYLESESMTQDTHVSPQDEPETGNTEAPTDPAEAEQPKPRGGFARGLLIFLNLLLLAALGAGGYFGWTFWQQWQGQKAELMSELEQQVTRQQQQQSRQVNQQFDQLRSELAAQQQSAASLEQGVQQRLSEMSQNLSEMNQSVKANSQYLEEVAGRRPNDWILAEADYLVNMAGRKLWLDHDVKTAIVMLAAADQRLAQLDDPSLLPIREKLAGDVQTLQQLNNPSLTEVALKLGALVRKVQDLPLNQVVLPDPVDTSGQTELTDSVSDWRDNLARSWRAFVDDFITVRRRTDDVEPLLDAQQQWLVKEQLRLALLRAQQAALQEQEALYYQALSDGRALVEANFDSEAPAVKGFINQLGELEQLSLEADYPDSLEADKPLTELLEKRVQNVFKGLQS